MTKTRKLAAVMFTDIVGYTAMMSKHEDRTIDLVQKSRDIHESLVTEFHGEVLEVIGDGTLCCFQSALDAVQCAIVIQEQVAQEPELNLRIGIHLGDIVFSGGNVYGEGVNVASRIETAAEPGGVHVSEQIYLQVRNRPEISAGFVGRKRFKNVEDPVGVYTIEARGENALVADVGQGGTTQTGLFVDTVNSPAVAKDVKAIAVLPFDDMSPGRDNEYFSDGLTEEIIADLSQVKALRVISRTSVMMLKGTDKNLRTIGRELGVQYVLEGSVRKAKNNLRITAQLIDAVNDTHLWAKKYNGSIEDVFDIQEQVSRAIVEGLRITLSLEEQEAIGQHELTDIHAHECLLRARHEMIKGTETAIAQAFVYLSEASRTAKDNIEIYSVMVEAYFTLFHMTGIDLDETLGKMDELADRILHIDPNSSHGHFCKGLVQYKKPWGFRETAKSYRRAAELNPNDTSMLLSRAMLAMNAGHLKIANACLKRLLLLDPISPANRMNKGWILMFSGEFEASAEEMSNILQMDPSNDIWRWCTIAALSLAGRTDEVTALAQQMPSASPHNFARLGLLYDAAFRGQLDEVNDLVSPELETTAIRDEIFSLTLAQCFALVGQKDVAIDWLENAVKYGFIHYQWFSEMDPLLENVRGEKRFGELLERIKLEWEHFEP